MDQVVAEDGQQPLYIGKSKHRWNSANEVGIMVDN